MFIEEEKKQEVTVENTEETTQENEEKIEEIKEEKPKEVKKQVKENVSEKDKKIELLEKQLAEFKKQSNTDKAYEVTNDIKKSLGLCDKLTKDFNTILDKIVVDDRNESVKNANLFAKLIDEVYKLGKNFASKENVKKVGENGSHVDNKEGKGDTGDVDIASLYKSLLGNTGTTNNEDLLKKFK